MDLNLYPDMSRQQYTKNDTFIYAAPLSSKAWTWLESIARALPNRKFQEGGYYLLPDDLPGLEDVIILRTSTMSDDDCMTVQAWIRMFHERTERAYCVAGKANITLADTIAAATGAPRALCKMVSIDEKEDEPKK